MEPKTTEPFLDPDPAALRAVPARSAHRPPVWRALIVELRPKQWIKNLICLAGLVFSGELFEGRHILEAGIAFGTFCLAASAIYIVNDLVDLDKDRHNPRTAGRPLAAGHLPVALAVLVGILLVAGALAGAAALNRACVLTIAAYLVINALYSFRLKETVIVDVMCIALGFVLRISYGAYAVEVYPSRWSVVCMFFLALFLGFGKRRAECADAGADFLRARPVLEKYNIDFLDMMLTVSATITVVAYALFTVSWQKNPTIVLTIIPVIYCVSRYLLQVIVLGHGKSPEDIILGDRMLMLGIGSWVALCIIIIYGDLHLFT
jgi:4-hydroxybenzoate polyprenyltransferase